MKICSNCKIEKEKFEFYKNKNFSDGFTKICKVCYKSYYDLNKQRERRLINHYKTDDKRKNLKCDLTIEWMKENITSKSCIYCGDTENIGCDRIDNLKGHSIDNVVPCCFICNTARSNNFTFREMFEIGATIRSIKERRN